MAAGGARSTQEMKTTLERELKLDAGPRFRLPGLPGEPLAPRTLTNIYLDTPDHRLAVAGVTLRRRVEGRKSLWQLKLPQGKARLELELPGDAHGADRRESREGRTQTDVPPAQMVDLVTVFARGAPLVPVATLRSRRQGVLVRDARGPVAEVVLDSVQVLHGSSTVKRFREIEVELTGGDEADLERLERALRAAGAADGDGRPKLLRALDIEPAPPPEPTPPEAPAVEQVRAMIEAQVRQIIANDPGTRLGQNPEPLHQMRVACRRLRTLLREAGSMLDPEWVEPLREEIGWLGDELGAVRDLDVLRQHLSDEVAALDPAEARGGALLIRALEVERGGRREELVATLRSERYFKLLGALEDATHKPQIADPDVSLESVAHAAFKRLRARPCDGWAPSHPTRPCTRSGSRPSARGTPPSWSRRRAASPSSASSSAPRSSRTSSASTRTPWWPASASAPWPLAAATPPAHLSRVGCWSARWPGAQKF
jgi:inorganic triphosphatase YgiF